MDEPAQQQETHSLRRPRRRQSRIVRRIVIPLVLLGLWTYGFYALGQQSVYTTHPGLAGQDRADAILQKVAGLVHLPPGVPQMAQITNAAQASKTQPFLKNAQDGDVIIVYTNAKIAILYRPSTNKIVRTGPLVAGNPPQGSTPIGPANKTPTITDMNTASSSTATSSTLGK